MIHPFIQAVITNYGKYIDPVVDQYIQFAQSTADSQKERKRSKKAKSKTFIPKLTEEQDYQNEVFIYTYNLTGAIERLEEIPLYIARFPKTKTLEKKGITVHRWINYHYANYLIIASSIYDATLLLVNSVFVLGLEPRLCNDGTVVNNKRVQGTKLSLQ
jgi:hypothetical protein